jgi:hypothetical protein
MYDNVQLRSKILVLLRVYLHCYHPLDNAGQPFLLISSKSSEIQLIKDNSEVEIIIVETNLIFKWAKRGVLGSNV